ncbi:retrovirus-related pol polyprotein from transposon TNT 1-94 [Tanacetum coccineum]
MCMRMTSSYVTFMHTCMNISKDALVFNFKIHGAFGLGHNHVIQIRGGVLAESSQSSESSIGVKCDTCGSTVHSTTNHNEFDHSKRGEKIQTANAREPTKNGCSRSMTGVKSYLHKYVEQPGPKVVFGDNSSCIPEGYGSINYGGVQGTIFNANKEIVLIAPRRNDVYVLDMSSLTPNGACFFAKASESINWLWHKRLSHLNFMNINKLAKQNKVLGLPSLVYSKDKPCTACEKGKHHRASFKTKQNFSIRKCLHLLHMDLFGPVSLMSINHKKYTLVIVDEYSRYIWVHFLRKNSQAQKMIMSFIKMVENQNDVKVKQIRTDNEIEFRNHELESFCDEKGISQNFSSPYTLEQNGVAKRKNITLIEVARTMLNESLFSKHFWTEAVRIAYILLSQKLPESLTQEDNKYPPDEIIHEDDLSKQYQANFDISYYVIPYGRSLFEITQEKHVPEVIAPNEPDIPLTKDTEGTNEQNIQNEQIITQPTEGPSGKNTEVSVSISESLAPDVRQSLISNQASISSHLVP